jgi:FkbM family methyltransferase
MARHAAAVHAFEPYEPIIERLRRNVAINQLANITIHPVGLGNEDAKVPFYKPPDFNEGSGSFIPNYSGENSNYHELTIVKGDEELAGAGEISLIKIDVQGFEKEVLAGMKATLAKNRSIILCELTVRPAAPFGFKSKSEILAVLPDNYRLLSFDMRDFDLFLGRYALIEFDREVDFTRDAFYEFVAYPIEKETQISLSGPKRRYED